MNGLSPPPGIFWKQLGQAVFVCTGGTLTFFGISLYNGSEKFYRQMAMPALQWLGAERAHNLAVIAAKYKMVPKPTLADSPNLKTQVWGLEFSNPVGLAAGFDKHGEAVEGLMKVGFGFVEVGSITPEPQPGNPKPRVFRLKKDKAVINRYGFNSDGHESVYQRLHPRATPTPEPCSLPRMSEQRNMLNVNLWTDTSCAHSADNNKNNVERKGVLGVNLGKNKTSTDSGQDYVRGVKKFGCVADYLVINVSSPNTPGLRSLQGRQQLEDLLDKVVTARDELRGSHKPPLLVKIAPDLTDQDKQDIAAVVSKKKCGVDGLIVTNTTVSRPPSLMSDDKAEIGGLSGEPLKTLSTATVRDMYRLTQGKIPIIGVGGISSGVDAYEKIRAGASLVQLYTALVYQGPPVVSRIKRELQELLQSDGYSNISQAVGADHREK
ncbi:dihydroorotate dehydrogenase (quinone), mitochondrial-like isoform X2 [Haliotis rufescens]|uniref:dihydroorotate dehydrogenase (quinone), mitochondrial-like isoform X2 n=1 Tax=Haliotis rufescens TaxID=6454 RepID=UPI00201F59FE|nr:dihydroorotate dehydrogenase (quinone), mitochondrial-like isoform X2 [Haliotis rufescens]